MTREVRVCWGQTAVVEVRFGAQTRMTYEPDLSLWDPSEEDARMYYSAPMHVESEEGREASWQVGEWSEPLPSSWEGRRAGEGRD